MNPGSSKKVPRRLTLIGPIDFWDPWGSKVTPGVPKVTPGVPKVTPGVPRLTPGVPNVGPGVPKVITQYPPSLKKDGAWEPKAIPRPLSKLLFAFLPHPVFATMFPAKPWPHQPNNPSTPIPFNTGPAECAERLK